MNRKDVYLLTVVSVIIGLIIMLATGSFAVKLFGGLFMIPIVVFRIKHEVIDYGREIEARN